MDFGASADTVAARREENERRMMLGYEEFALCCNCKLPLTWPVVLVATFCFLLTLFIPVVWLGRDIDSLALLVLTIPLGLFGYVALQKRHVISLVQIYARFLFGWFVVTPLALLLAVCGCVLFYVFLAIFAGILETVLFNNKHEHRETHENHLWFHILIGSFAVFGFAGMFVGTGCIGKYITLTQFDKYQDLTNPRAYTFYGCALALGVGTFETMSIVLFLRKILDDEEGDSFGAVHLLIIAGIAAVLIIPMHIFESYYVGLAIARQQVLKHDINAFWSAVGAALFRTMFVTSFFEVPFLTRSYFGLIAPVLVLLIYGYYVFWYERNKMPREYLRRTGYMHFFGYGMLLNDDGDVEDEGPHHQATAAPTAVVINAVPSADARFQTIQEAFGTEQEEDTEWVGAPPMTTTTTTGNNGSPPGVADAIITLE